MNNRQDAAANVRRKRKREREKANKQRALQERLKKARIETGPNGPAPPYDPDYDSSSDSDSGGDDGYYYGEQPAMPAPPPEPAIEETVTDAMADMINRSLQQLETEQAAGELPERVVPASALLDTTSFGPRRSLANLAGFVETCTVPLCKQKMKKRRKKRKEILCLPPPSHSLLRSPPPHVLL